MVTATVITSEKTNGKFSSSRSILQLPRTHTGYTARNTVSYVDGRINTVLPGSSSSFSDVWNWRARTTGRKWRGRSARLDSRRLADLSAA